MRFDHIIWDLDGTLFDTYPPLITSIERALGELEVAVPRADLVRLLNDTLATCMDEIATRHALDALVLEARVAYYQRQVTERDQPPFDGVICLCERFLKAGGQNLIFTHRSRESAMRLLDWYRVEGLFAECLTVEDGYARKPDPAGFNALIERHALPRGRVLAVGDRALDIVAGQRAGIRTCLFRGEPDPAYPPDFTITAFDELRPILHLPV
ncbi:MAG: HAD hydrolase-like protein [Anaerolineae bacterium]|nr:HAD hydrolase-like protein [Anaerolineae bacterium]MEB2287619.1 HAD hydrolase-like protein [Anaerolineae bacterium]